MSIYLFVLGASFGSFALAMVSRMKSGRNWVRGRSACESCKKTLKMRDLIPIFSWLYTKGRCRYCGVKLSSWYPSVELALGLVFTLSYIYWPEQLVSGYEIARLVIWLLATVVMAGLVIFDVKWYLLPNKLVYPLILLSLSWVYVDALENGVNYGTIVDYGLSILVASGFFLMLYVVSKGKWIGDGDIRLGVAIGLFTGSAVQSWLVLFLASIIGLAVSVPVLFSNRGVKSKMKLQIPFGPMLIFALIIVILFGQNIVEWYSSDILLI